MPRSALPSLVAVLLLGLSPAASGQRLSQGLVKRMPSVLPGNNKLPRRLEKPRTKVGQAVQKLRFLNRKKRNEWIRRRGEAFRRIGVDRNYAGKHVLHRTDEWTAFLDHTDPVAPDFDPQRPTDPSLAKIPPHERAHILLIPNQPREHIARSLSSHVTLGDLDVAWSLMEAGQHMAKDLGIENPQVYINNQEGISVGYLHVHITGRRGPKTEYPAPLDPSSPNSMPGRVRAAPTAVSATAAARRTAGEARRLAADAERLSDTQPGAGLPPELQKPRTRLGRLRQKISFADYRRRNAWYRARGEVFRKIAAPRSDYRGQHVLERTDEWTMFVDHTDSQHPDFDPDRPADSALTEIPQDRRGHILIIPNQPREHIAESLTGKATLDDLDIAWSLLEAGHIAAEKYGFVNPQVFINNQAAISVGYLHVHVTGERAASVRYPRPLAPGSRPTTPGRMRQPPR